MACSVFYVAVTSLDLYTFKKAAAENFPNDRINQFLKRL